MTKRERLLRAAGAAARWAKRHAAMLTLTALVLWMARQVHYPGVSWGDDWTLYARQAESLYNGNIGEVIADNHFNVGNAAKPGFSPLVYPWGFPILLAPLLRVFGHDWETLKMAEAAFFCAFLWWFHAVLRRRMEQWLAFAVVAFTATSLPYLAHTGNILSELPYMASLAGTLWYLDRVRTGPGGTPRLLQHASRRELLTLGLLAVWVFNVRREGVALIAAVSVAQAADLWSERRDCRIEGRVPPPLDRRAALTPLVAFASGVAAFQLLLPSALAPEYEDSGLHQTWSKLRGHFQVTFADQLGFPSLHGWWLAAVTAVVLAGVVVRLRTAARLDLPILVTVVVSGAVVGMIPAIAHRYTMPLTPWAVYFAAQAVAAIPLSRVTPTLRAVAPWVPVTMLALLTVTHLIRVSERMDQVDTFVERGGVVDGPETPANAEALAAVRIYTHETDAVAFFKGRALTFYTGRYAVQSKELDVVRQRADFALFRRDADDGEPLVDDADMLAMGWELVWENSRWQLWRLPLYETP